MINLEQYLISEDEIATEGIKDFFKKIGNKLDNAAKNNYRKYMNRIIQTNFPKVYREEAAKNNYRKCMNRMIQTNFPEVYREELERRTKFINLVGKATDALATVLGEGYTVAPTSKYGLANFAAEFTVVEFPKKSMTTEEKIELAKRNGSYCELINCPVGTTIDSIKSKLKAFNKILKDYIEFIYEINIYNNTLYLIAVPSILYIQLSQVLGEIFVEVYKKTSTVLNKEKVKIDNMLKEYGGGIDVLFYLSAYDFFSTFKLESKSAKDLIDELKKNSAKISNKMATQVNMMSELFDQSMIQQQLQAQMQQQIQMQMMQDMQMQMQQATMISLGLM